MATFHMHSLVGFDPDGAGLVSEDDCWVELTPDLYRTFLSDIRADQAHALLRILTVATQLPLVAGAVQVHFVEYDVPVCVIAAPAAWPSIARPLTVGPENAKQATRRDPNRLPKADSVRQIDEHINRNADLEFSGATALGMVFTMTGSNLPSFQLLMSPRPALTRD